MKRKGRKEEGTETFRSCSHLLLILLSSEFLGCQRISIKIQVPDATKSNPDHPRLCSRKIRKIPQPSWRVTYCTNQGRASANFSSHTDATSGTLPHCWDLLAWVSGKHLRSWVQTQRWHTTLMRGNFHPKVAPFCHQPGHWHRKLVTSWVSMS